MESTSALRAAFADALIALDTAALTAHALTRETPPARDVAVLALGKGAATMLAGVARGSPWLRATTRVVLARPERARAMDTAVRAAFEQSGARVEEFAAGHPLPNAISARAGGAVMDAAVNASAVLVLLSGGASAAACVPRAGVSLREVIAVTRALMDAGAPIEVLNAARGEIDALKHGGLSRLAANAPVLTLACVDVLGPPARAHAALGSAPTLAHSVAPDLLAHARALLPASLRPCLDAPPVAPVPLGARVFREIAGPHTARDAFAHALRARGFTVRTLDDAAGDVTDLAAHYAREVPALAPGEALVRVGEPTVTLPAARGRGGRAGRLALLLVDALASAPGAAFLAGATDGVDGESGHAGAVVNSDTRAFALAHRVDLAGALTAFDDARAHEALGTALTPGPTGLNLLDLHALARAG